MPRTARLNCGAAKCYAPLGRGGWPWDLFALDDAASLVRAWRRMQNQCAALLGVAGLAVVLAGVHAGAEDTQAPAGSAAQPVAATETIPMYGEPLSLERAQRVMAAAEAEAKRLKVSPAIAVVDSTGHLVMFEKLNNSDYGNGDIAIALAKSAVEFRRPTKEFGDTVAKNPTIAFLPGVVPFQGGWPILTNDRLVGAIGVVGARGVAGAVNSVADAGVNAGR
jgi:glc operon protein GlcG